MTKSYLPETDAGKMQWLNNFAAKLPLYQAPLQLNDATLTEVQIWSDNFGYLIGNIELLRKYTVQYTAYKNLVRRSNASVETLGLLPPLPPAPIMPHGPTPNIFGQISKLVQLIKNNKGYNEAMGKDLGIIADYSGKNPHDLKPRITAQLLAGQPHIKWKKAGMQGIRIYVDRGNGYEYLATDIEPDYVDKHPLPPSGQAAVWRYKAIYILHDEEVGQMSDELVVTVVGKI